MGRRHAAAPPGAPPNEFGVWYAKPVETGSGAA
jgi:hypothetical protein